MDYEHNGKQSHATRLEMLIALNYLIDNCTSERKTSKTIDLQKYAQEKYNGEFIDRRKANDIFSDLVKFTNNYPNILPYKVYQVKDKPRYYVKKNVLENKDIDKIASAIKDHQALTERASKRLVEKFLNKVTDSEKKEQVLKTLGRTPSLVKHQVSEEVMDAIDKFEWLRDNQARFYFKLKRTPELDDVTSPRPFRTRQDDRRVRPIYPGYYAGYVFEVAQTSKSTKVCIYLPDYESAVITNINNIVLHNLHNPFPSEGDIIFELGNRRASLNDWYTSYFRGQSLFRLNRNVRFKFYAGHENYLLNNLKPKFEEFFKVEMQYELVDREVEVKHLDGTIELRNVQDAYVNVECCFNAFKKWYWESGAFENVVVIEPSNWNDRLLEEITEKFAKRLTKYGERCNYELITTMKPEYEEERRQRREEFIKHLKERSRREH